MKLVIYLKNILMMTGIMYVGLSYAAEFEKLPEEKFPRATPGETWNVEIKNKYGENIVIGVRYAKDKKQINKAQLIQDGGVIRFAEINTYRAIEISVWTQGQFGDNPNLVAAKPPKFTYVIAADGNTIFVALDQNGNLYPQRGELLGFTGKTQSGLSKTSNVKKSDITVKAPLGTRIQK